MLVIKFAPGGGKKAAALTVLAVVTTIAAGIIREEYREKKYVERLIKGDTDVRL